MNKFETPSSFRFSHATQSIEDKMHKQMQDASRAELRRCARMQQQKHKTQPTNQAQAQAQVQQIDTPCQCEDVDAVLELTDLFEDKSDVVPPKATMRTVADLVMSRANLDRILKRKNYIR